MKKTMIPFSEMISLSGILFLVGCRFLGKDRIPYHPKDVEEFMAANKE
jgi:hypothetical protein